MLVPVTGDRIVAGGAGVGVTEGDVITAMALSRRACFQAVVGVVRGRVTGGTGWMKGIGVECTGADVVGIMADVTGSKACDNPHNNMIGMGYRPA